MLVAGPLPSAAVLAATVGSGFLRGYFGRGLPDTQLVVGFCLVQLVSLFLETLCGVCTCLSWEGPPGPPS